MVVQTCSCTMFKLSRAHPRPWSVGRDQHFIDYNEVRVLDAEGTTLFICREEVAVVIVEMANDEARFAAALKRSGAVKAKRTWSKSNNLRDRFKVHHVNHKLPPRGVKS